MKKFLRENSYLIVKLVVFQLGIMILGLVTAFATNQSSTWLFVGASVFCIAFYLYLIHTVAYESGQKDGIRIEAGKAEKTPWKFFFVMLCANVLNIVLGVLALVFKLFITGASVTKPLVGGMLSPKWAVSGYEICNLIARFIQSMYIGVIQTISPNNAILVALLPIPAILVGAVSYNLGVKFKDGVIKRAPKETKTVRYSNRPERKD